MDEAKEFVLDFVQSNGGETTYPELLEAYPPKERNPLRNVLKQLKANGQIEKFIRASDMAHVIRLPQTGGE